jgi:RNase H-like domain found in reverse transcriptase
LLTYPNFNKTFEIHTDTRKVQLGACISQEGRPVAFYSRKLNPAQTQYTTTERELLSIVETLKEFRNNRTTNSCPHRSCKSDLQKTSTLTELWDGDST